jgi:hypothetical protein
MRTVVAGTALVLSAYFAQSALFGWLWGARAAAVYLISLPVAADINFYLSDRTWRAMRRARAFLRFKRDPALQQRLIEELGTLRGDVIALDRALDPQDVAASA